MEIAAGSEKYSSTARSAGRHRPEARKNARRERIWLRTKHPVREIATCTVARAASSSNVGGGLGSFLGRKAHMGEIVGEGCDVWGHAPESARRNRSALPPSPGEDARWADGGPRSAKRIPSALPPQPGEDGRRPDGGRNTTPTHPPPQSPLVTAPPEGEQGSLGPSPFSMGKKKDPARGVTHDGPLWTEMDRNDPRWTGLWWGSYSNSKRVQGGRDGSCIMQIR